MLITKRITVSTLAALALAVPVPSVVHAQAGAIITLVMPAGQFGSDPFTRVVGDLLGAARGFFVALERSHQGG
ncbi:MAG: hypothetical protein AB3N11_11240, partial [Arenibacterium sp.]